MVPLLYTEGLPSLRLMQQAAIGPPASRGPAAKIEPSPGRNPLLKNASGVGAAVALPTLCTEWRAGRSGDAGYGEFCALGRIGRQQLAVWHLALAKQGTASTVTES